jgi:predicted NUDIX family NTP pyrophosphohydrolase
LVHPGGPLWRKKDLGGWSIPKGEVLAGEDDLTAARREFEEETGIKPAGEFVSLGEIKQPSGKVVIAWVFEGMVHRRFTATRFRWNGRQNPVERRSFRKWIEQSGFL